MINSVIHKVADQIDFTNKTQSVSYLNIYNYKILRNFPQVVGNIDYFTFDGIMLVLFARLIKGIKINRQSPDFSSYFLELFSFLNTQKKSVYLLGGSFSEIREFTRRIKIQYPDIIISGYHNGFDYKEEEIINTLISGQVDTVIVGMGTPKQELFVSKLKELGFKGSSYTCGAFFGQTVSSENDYYPKLMNDLHLRWAFRIYKEPKLIKRYFIQYPIGLAYLLKDNFDTKKEKNHT